jgi:hypothetical protein
MDKTKIHIYKDVHESIDPKKRLNELLEFMVVLHNTWIDNDKPKVGK